MGLVQVKQEQLAKRLAGLQLPRGGWLEPLREAALARLAAMGLPGRRDEYWRYSDPAGLISAEPQQAAVFSHDDETPLFGAVERVELVFVDGVFDAGASDDPLLAGVEIERLGSVGGMEHHWARDFYSSLEAEGQSPVARPLAAMNSAYASDGFLLRVTGKVKKQISLIYRRESESSDVMLHHCIKVEPGAEVTLTENGAGAARFNVVMEIELGAGARLHHIREQGRDHERRSSTHIFARVQRDAVLKSFTLTANGRMTRNEVVVELSGDDAVVHLSGAAVGDGAFHHDDTVFITHQGQRCESRQVFKKVLKNGALGVFQGKILVKRGAQKTDGYQTSQALLLDGDSQFLAKPELEIYADDVKCSHGSTSGAIDAGALYYLRSRGVPLRAAQSLLVLAFLAEAIAEIEDATVAEDMRARLEGWLSRHEH